MARSLTTTGLHLNLTLNRPQFRAFECFGPKRTVTLPFGRGCGKSWLLRCVCWLTVAQWDGRPRAALKPFAGVRIVWLMDTLTHWKDVHARLVEQELNDEWAFLGAKLNRTTWAITFPGGSWVQPFPAADYHSKHARGLRCDVVLADECDDIDLGVWQSVAVPWFSEPWSLKMRMAGGTPRRGRYGLLYALHSLGKSDAPNYHTVHATYRDCPETVDPETVADAKANTPPEIFRRERECDFDSAEGLVYGLFDESFHVRSPRPDAHYNDVLVGVDWGYVHPGSFIVIGVSGKGQDAVSHVIRD